MAGFYTIEACTWGQRGARAKLNNFTKNNLKFVLIHKWNSLLRYPHFRSDYKSFLPFGIRDPCHHSLQFPIAPSAQQREGEKVRGKYRIGRGMLELENDAHFSKRLKREERPVRTIEEKSRNRL